MVNIKPLTKLFEQCRVFHAHTLFDYFLDDILASFGRPLKQEAPDEIREILFSLGAAYADAVRSNEPFSDILGLLYMDMASHGSKKWLGQFFTPQHISDMMAMVTIGDQLPEKDGSLVTICDPACGSGVMLLSAAKYIFSLRQGGSALSGLSLTGVDLDSYCARMTAAQLLGNCLVHQLQLGEIAVYNGNSLFPSERMELVIHATGADTPDVVPAMHPARIDSIQAAAKSQQVGQLNLFESNHDEDAA